MIDSATVERARRAVHFYEKVGLLAETAHYEGPDAETRFHNAALQVLTGLRFVLKEKDQLRADSQARGDSVINEASFYSTTWQGLAADLAMAAMGALRAAVRETREIGVPSLVGPDGDPLRAEPLERLRYDRDVAEIKPALRMIHPDALPQVNLSRIESELVVAQSRSGEGGEETGEGTDDYPNNARDHWMWERQTAGDTRYLIRSKLKAEHPEWEQLETDAAVTLAVKRYCGRTKKPRPRKG